VEVISNKLTGKTLSIKTTCTENSKKLPIAIYQKSDPVTSHLVIYHLKMLL